MVAKQTLYKTAYSPTFNVYVGIESAYLNDNGEWVYTCNSDYTDTVLTQHLFSERELTHFCL